MLDVDTTAFDPPDVELSACSYGKFENASTHFTLLVINNGLLAVMQAKLPKESLVAHTGDFCTALLEECNTVPEDPDERQVNLVSEVINIVKGVAALCGPAYSHIITENAIKRGHVGAAFELRAPDS